MIDRNRWRVEELVDLNEEAERFQNDVLNAASQEMSDPPGWKRAVESLRGASRRLERMAESLQTILGRAVEARKEQARLESERRRRERKMDRR